MEKSKVYYDIRFSADVIRSALEIYQGKLPKKVEILINDRTATHGGETWEFDSNEEFFAIYRKSDGDSAHFFISHWKASGIFSPMIKTSFSVLNYERSCRVTVEMPTTVQIEAVFDVFEKNAEASKLPEESAPTALQPRIFIGHGRSAQWRDLKDHLTDKHGYQVVAYEVGARAGHTIRDILDEMLAQSSFAFLVMTAEDEAGDGQMRARQNVVHELGLFQGKLGFARAIVIVERGVELFSNIDGVQQLRFSEENIAEVYGDVLATLYREFGNTR
jgi:predicted nucleotide-binding protein